MSGGGSKKKSSTDASTGSLAHLGIPSPMAIPQAMPGQLEAIAAQLSAGFGGTPQAHMAQIDALYSPMNIGGPAPAVSGGGKPNSPANTPPKTGTISWRDRRNDAGRR